MIKAVIRKHAVELWNDGYYFGDIYGDRIKVSFSQITKRPLVVIDLLTVIHPDKIEDNREKEE